MKNHILHLLTRTPLHVGAGSSVGAVDQPVQRERHTGFPIIPGSSLKGVFRDFFENHPDWKPQEAIRLFGKAGDADSRSGILCLGEARILIFPVRSASGAFALVTCPLALGRYARDASLALRSPSEPPQEMEALAGTNVQFNGKVILEEYAFTVKGNFPTDWAEHLVGLLDDAVLSEAADHLVLLSNGDFAHFVRSTCPVAQHVGIDDETGTHATGALYNEEMVPSETLFFSPIVEQTFADEDSAVIEKALENLSRETLMQFGGNNTTGLGFTTTKIAPATKE